MLTTQKLTPALALSSYFPTTRPFIVRWDLGNEVLHQWNLGLIHHVSFLMNVEDVVVGISVRVLLHCCCRQQVNITSRIIIFRKRALSRVFDSLPIHVSLTHARALSSSSPMALGAKFQGLNFEKPETANAGCARDLINTIVSMRSNV